MTASRGDVVVDCMGSIAATSAVAPFALTEQDGSILVTWGEQRMVCPVELADDRAQGGRPGLRTTVRVSDCAPSDATNTPTASRSVRCGG